MNKLQAKMPRDENVWQEIDIYLFCNGQHYSPPRKYHLRADELNWWESTLAYLGRSLYGSLYSRIHLYTIDGHRIQGPLELKDGSPYVAVVPPDDFINSGYEKYLIRASRSWEKRQAKRAGVIETAESRQDCGHLQPCCSCPRRDTEEDLISFHQGTSLGTGVPKSTGYPVSTCQTLDQDPLDHRRGQDIHSNKQHTRDATPESHDSRKFGHEVQSTPDAINKHGREVPSESHEYDQFAHKVGTDPNYYSNVRHELPHNPDDFQKHHRETHDNKKVSQKESPSTHDFRNMRERELPYDPDDNNSSLGHQSPGPHDFRQFVNELPDNLDNNKGHAQEPVRQSYDEQNIEPNDNKTYGLWSQGPGKFDHNIPRSPDDIKNHGRDVLNESQEYKKSGHAMTPVARDVREFHQDVSRNPDETEKLGPDTELDDYNIFGQKKMHVPDFTKFGHRITPDLYDVKNVDNEVTRNIDVSNRHDPEVLRGVDHLKSIGQVETGKQDGFKKFKHEKTFDPNSVQAQNIAPEGQTGQSIRKISGVEQAIGYVSTISDLTTIKTPDDNIAVESVLVKPWRTSTPKLEKVSGGQKPRRSIIVASKQSNNKNERRRSNGPHTSFATNSNIVVTQAKLNTRPKNKEPLNKRMLTKIPIKVSEPGNGVDTKSKKTVKRPYSNITPNGKAKATLNNKSLTTDCVPIENLINDKDIIIVSTDNNLFRNVESEVRSMKLDSYCVPVMDAMIDCYVQKGDDKEIQTKTETTNCEVNTTVPNLPNNGVVKVIPGENGPLSNVVTCNIPLEDNCIAVINKGNAVNLNLNIELQDDTIKHTNNVNKNDSKINSIADIFKIENTQNQNNEKTLAQTNSMQSDDGNVSYAKVVVVQCACCGNNTVVPRLDTLPVYKDENGFFILIPSPGPNESCSCENKRKSIDKKTLSELCVGTLTRRQSETVYPCVVQEVGMLTTVTSSVTSQTGDCHKNSCDTTVTTKQRVIIQEDRCNVETCATSTSQTLKTDQAVSRCSLSSRVSCSCVESQYTQTEWCSLLLQVRHHEDGHYSFHLPPLHVLKCYSLT